ncbi:twin-arginine translocase TatA/TatE family subunit [Enemella sp. A6]|uniref:twin-arginine translocase TatA/TatE family subunit n=1 Tax=Enemella sp. A6 TaxID=3440152 RepID=UPI003EB7304F
MVPMFIGTTELLILLALALLIFGGAKLAGLGRGAGRAIREFKEETKGIGSDPSTDTDPTTEPKTEIEPDRPADGAGDDVGRNRDG